jgi:hypothetical protein
MKLRVGVILAFALLCLAPTASWADLATYSQDFEGLDQTDPAALANDGWWVFGNVFGPDWGYWYSYGAPAPNGGPGFCGIDLDQGGPEQGVQQMVVYNDYNNSNHGDGAHIEANVFQERTIGAADVGGTWLFEFDAKRGNIDGDTTALAFFKTLDPNDGWALTNFITIDMTDVPAEWDSYSLSILIDPTLEGQILQFGFLTVASYYEGSGIFYDNIGFDLAPLAVSVDIKPDGLPNSINPHSRGVLPVAILGSDTFDVTTIDVTTLSFGPDAVSTAHNLTDTFTYNDHLRDVNLDGYMDLVSHYMTRATGIACGDESATMTGATLSGQAILGSDSLRTVGCRVFMRPMIWKKDLDKPEMPRRDGPVNIERR